jgi:hypothetical protein
LIRDQNAIHTGVSSTDLDSAFGLLLLVLLLVLLWLGVDALVKYLRKWRHTE